MKNLIIVMLLACISLAFGAAITDIKIAHPESKAQIVRQIPAETPKEILRQTINYLVGVLGGAKHASIDYQLGENDAAYATGKIRVLGSGSNANRIYIGGITLTGLNYASTASYNQFNTGSTAALTAASIVNAINNGSLANIVTASLSGASVILTAHKYGEIGNAIGLAENSGATVYAVSTGSIVITSLIGGSDPTSNTYHYGY